RRACCPASSRLHEMSSCIAGSSSTTSIVADIARDIMYQRLQSCDRSFMPGPHASAPQPTEIKLHQASRVLEISCADGKTFRLPCEFLRVYSPSAEVRGHGPGQEVLQTGKKDVGIDRIEPVGNYAVQFYFSDGHDTGIY